MRTKDPTMTATNMNLGELLEQAADTDFFREMIGFTATPDGIGGRNPHRSR